MDSKALLFAVLLAGAASLMYELSATEILFFFFPESSQTIAIVLATFMFGLFLGASAYSKIIEHHKDGLNLFAALQISAGVSVLLLSLLFSNISELLSYLYTLTYPDAFIPRLFLGVLALLAPSFFFGSSFPAIVEEYTQKTGKGRFGPIYAVDVFGAMAGVLITGFLLFPTLGVIATSTLCASLNFLAAAVIASGRNRKLSVLATVLFFVTAALVILLLNPTTTKFTEGSWTVEAFRVSNFTTYPCDGSHVSIVKPSIKINDDVIFSQNSPYGLVFITGGDMGRVLWIDNRNQCSTLSKTEFNLGETSANILEENSSVMSIGLGCGFTLQGILLSKNVVSVDVIEINPTIIDASGSCFWNKNYSVLTDPRTTIYVDDAAHYLIINNKKYDAIVMDIQNPTVVQSSPLYTSEYFELMKGSLNEGGILSVFGYGGISAWKPIIYQTLKQSFSNVYYLKDGNSDIYYASDNAIDPDALRMNESDRNMTIQLNNTQAEINTLQRPVLRYP
ncbi:MAG: hypothetical protein ABIG39_06775 [Candidatus Micrarchaeota archaeon]